MYLVSTPKECLIIGSGTSIKPWISSLQPLCATKFTIGINYSFKTFQTTILTCQDRDFYHGKPNDMGIYENPDIYDELKKLPLIIGLNTNGVDEFKLNNTILLPKTEREPLTGLFALKLAMRLMDTGTVYLLGFDWSRRTGLPERDPNYNPKSEIDLHYYRNEITHSGTGYYGYYENHDANKEFLKLTKKNTLKIYNVSPDSNITCFEKINYEKMFGLLSTEIINQEVLRTEIRSLLCIK